METVSDYDLDRVRFGGCHWCEQSGELIDADAKIRHLRPHSLSVFRCLAAEPGRLISKAELTESVWPGVVVVEDSLVQCVREIRNALRDTDRNILVTVYRRGYRLMPDFKENTQQASTVSIADKLIPLLGREKELDQITDALWGKSAPSSSFVLVSGLPGVGKTRISEELLNLAQRTGRVAALGSAHEISESVGYSMLTCWLRSPAIYKNLSELPISIRTEVALLIPEVVEQTGPKTSRSANQIWNQVRFFDAICRAVVGTSSSVTLFLENLQWADPETLQWLGYAMLQKHCCFSLVATLRIDSQTSDVVDKLLTSLAQANIYKLIKLEALDEKSSIRLAAAVGGSRFNELKPLKEFQRTGGIPLFVIQSALCGADFEPTKAVANERIQEAIDFRTRNLDTQSLHVLQAIATYGTPSSISAIGQLTQLTRIQASVAVQILLDKALIVRNDNRYVCPHDLIRDVIYSQIQPALRTTLHNNSARVLRRLVITRDVRRSEENVKYAVGEHHRKAGAYARAFCWFRKAATDARHNHAIYAQASAERAQLSVLQLLSKSRSTTSAQINLLLDLGLSESAAHGWGNEASYRAWRQAGKFAEKTDDTVLQVRAINAMDTWHRDAGNWHRCEILSRRALKLLPQIDDRYLYLCVQSSHAALQLHTGQSAQALQTYEKVLAENDDSIQPSFNWFTNTFQIGGLFRSAQCLWLIDHKAEAYSRADEALRIATTQSTPFHQAITLFHVLLVYEFERDHRKVKELAQRLADIADEYGFTFYQKSARLSLAIADTWSDEFNSENWRPIEELTDSLLDTGCRMFEPYWQCNLAHAFIEIGEHERASMLAQSTLYQTAITHNRFWDSQLKEIATRCKAR